MFSWKSALIIKGSSVIFLFAMLYLEPDHKIKSEYIKALSGAIIALLINNPEKKIKRKNNKNQ